MDRSKDCVALITARGGSKRLPGKNIRPLGGKPLIAWSIEAALAAHSIGRVIVSTDDPGIASAAAAAGAQVPFLRPAEISGDHASHYDVIAHALDWLEQETGRLPQLLCLLQPTSPLRTGDDIDALVELVSSRDADAGVSVASVPVHPAYMYRVDADMNADLYMPREDGVYLRSQDLEPLYYVNGAVYVLRPATFRLRNTVLPDRPVAHVMPRERSADIDDATDFELAERYIALRRPVVLSKPEPD